MGEVKHTPGPWHTGGKNGAIIYDSTGWAVGNAETYHGRGDDPVKIMAANAKLIALAPEMLAACRTAFNDIKRHGDMTAEGWDALEGIIEKSEGL